MGTRQEQLDQIVREKEALVKQVEIMERLDKLEQELKLTRKGNEAFVYGEEVEESDEVDLEEVEDA